MISNARLQSWVNTLVSDEEALMELRTRFQLRMLDRFRRSTPEQREQINAIMDNEQAFFDELNAIADDIVDANLAEEGDEDNNN